MFTKKPDKWKKYSVSIIVLAASFIQIWSSSDFSVVQVTSVEKRESREHFSASAYGLGFKKFSLGSLFSTSVPWTTLQSDEDKFVLRLGSTIIETKYYFFRISNDFRILGQIQIFVWHFKKNKSEHVFHSCTAMLRMPSNPKIAEQWWEH